jgi:hypothetical protein
MKPGEIEWTDDKIAEMARLYALGLSFGSIAREMGAPTRNAIVGKISRLRQKGSALFPPRKIEAERARDEIPHVVTPPVTLPARQVTPQPKPPLVCETANSVLFIEAQARHCRWPLWETHRRTDVSLKKVCGNPVIPGRSFCARCHGLAFSISTKTRAAA